MYLPIFAACVCISSAARSSWKILTPEEAYNATQTRMHELDSVVTAKDVTRKIPQDYGGNYGDLILRYREDGDILLLRELLLIEELSASEVDIEWLATLNARRISSVRVLNIGRERAYCARIGIAERRAQVLLRVAPKRDPRVLVEIYGF